MKACIVRSRRCALRKKEGFAAGLLSPRYCPSSGIENCFLRRCRGFAGRLQHGVIADLAEVGAPLSVVHVGRHKRNDG